MLVLTRKLGESININENIKITVIDIKGNQVRIGIEAPKEFSIHREEIYNRIKEENIFAASESPINVSYLTRMWKNIEKRRRKD